jgi:glyoxylase-like metal-dependent hydrolase (beta-lactamase superfamily II)
MVEAAPRSSRETVMIQARHTRLSRRGFCLCCIASGTFLTTGGGAGPREAFAKARTIVDLIRSEAAEASITIHELRGNVFVLEGSGGNIGVLAAPSGKVLVDAGITASQGRIREALAKLGDGSVTHLVNTHWHFDHADGNEWLHEEGAVILAHENTRRHLMTAQRVEDWNFDFPPSPPGAVPSIPVSDDEVIELQGSTLAMKHYPGAHTDGDITVTFVGADIVHAGDIYWNGAYPFIDYSTGGNIDRTIRAADAILSAATDRSIIIPGHGNPLSNRSELLAYRDMLVAIRDNVGALKGQGKSLQEIIADKPTATFDSKWGQFVIKPDFFTRLVYQGV